MKHLVRFSKILVCLLACAALSAPVIAQPAVPPDLLGDIDVIGAGELEKAIGNAITTNTEEIEDALSSAITEATEQLGAGGTVGGVFGSPAFLTILYGLLGSVVTFFATNGAKLSTSWIRGRKTQLLAAALSALTAGVGGYFGLSEVAGVNGIEGALLSALSALGAYAVAVGAHERNRYQETGQRKPERKAGAMVSDTVLEGLVLAAKVLPVPLPEALIRSMYAAHGAKVVKDLIDRQRALTEAEMNAEQDRYKAANPVTPEELAAAKAKAAARTAPTVTPAPTKENPDA